MKNTTSGVISKEKGYIVSQKITRPKVYGRNVIILDYENEKPVSELEVIIRVASEISYHMPYDDGTIDTIFTKKGNEKIMVDVSSFIAEKKEN